MLSTLESKKIKISIRMNGQDLGILFEDASIETVLRFIECTAVGKRREVYDAQRNDEWDIDQLD
jgi:CRISPR/Cas system CSM-associated protein Csm5 (group 7 of RAMP superfamily)